MRKVVHAADPDVTETIKRGNQGQGNLTARAIQVRQGDTLDDRALLELLRAVIANNRARGWRKVQHGQ